jgi:type IV secretion system protein VirB4
MVSFKEKAKELEELGHSFSELVPWLVKLNGDKILCKDGSVMCSFIIEGHDKSGKTKEETDQWYNTLDRAYRTISDEKVMVWWSLLKRKTNVYPYGEYDNKFSKIVDDEYRKSISRYNIYTKRTYLTMLVRPSIGSGRYLETYVRNINNGASSLEAIKLTLKQALNAKERGMVDAEEIIKQMHELDEYANSFQGAAIGLTLRKLKDEELMAHLGELVSPATDPARKIKISKQTYIDDYLPSNTIDVNGDHLVFSGPQHEKIISVFSPKLMPEDWPEFSEPGMIDCLSEVDSELNITIAMKMVSPIMAKKYANSAKKHHITLQKGIFTLAKEAILKVKLDEEINKDRQKFASEIEGALDGMSYNPAAAFVNLSLTLIADSLSEMEEATSASVKALNQAELVPFRERIHLLSSWAGTLPGQWMQSLRWAFLIGGNLSDLSPITSKDIGDPVNQHLSNFFGKKCNSLALFMDEDFSPYYFNFHRGDLPHALVLGPSRAGKSIFDTLNITFWQKYGGQTIIFDKDSTCKISTLLQGGNHLDPLTDFKLNPFVHMTTNKDWQWGVSWISKLLEANKQPPLNPEDQKQLTLSLETFRAFPDKDKRLLTLANLLPNNLSLRLEPWIGNGKFSVYFDNEKDDFEFSKFVCIEMSEIMKEEDVARAFMDYAFWRIDKWLKGNLPTIIYIEEAWFMLMNEKFAAQLNDWLRTLAKKEAFVVMCTQSLDEVAKSSAFAAIIDNIQTRFYLPNPSVGAHIDLYREKLGLNDAVIELIKTSTPKQDYILVTPELVRILKIPLNKKVLAVLRSDKKAQQVFTKWQSSGRDDWRDQYVNEMSA